MIILLATIIAIMTVEIERKFLVSDASFLQQHRPHYFRQAYLNSDKQRTVRIRQQDQQAFITIKGKTSGISRQEFEYPIPLSDANALFALCETKPIEKNRYFIEHGKHCFEVDVFLGENAGLIIAEIELDHENESFTKPYWLGQEVSGESRYFNSQLSLTPYCSWV